MKQIIFLLIIFSLISCKDHNSFCIKDKSISHTNASTAIDIRCVKIKQEERAKNPDACKKKPGFNDAIKTIHTKKEELYVSWSKCQAQKQTEKNRCDTLPPAKPEDWVPSSGSFFNFGNDWVMINGKRVKKSTLPLCSKCEKCKPVAPPLSPPLSPPHPAK